MTPEQLNDALRTVAIYDDPELQPLPSGFKRWGVGYKRGMPAKYENWYHIRYYDEMQYHTSYDWLMPVAKRVRDDLSIICKDTTVNVMTHLDASRLRFAITNRTVLYETIPTQMFVAIYEAINFLTKYQPTTT